MVVSVKIQTRLAYNRRVHLFGSHSRIGFCLTPATAENRALKHRYSLNLSWQGGTCVVKYVRSRVITEYRMSFQVSSVVDMVVTACRQRHAHAYLEVVFTFYHCAITAARYVTRA